ncbi:MAG: PIN domain-containing protein [Promethearchaeota archaeon]
MFCIHQINPIRIIVDTNFLMAIAQVRINLSMELEAVLDSHFELLIPDFVLDEIKNLVQMKNKKPKIRREAQFALRLAQQLCQELPQSQSTNTSVDSQIISLAKQLGAIVATNDKKLRATLKKEGILTIYLRGKNRLELSYCYS